MNVSKSLFSLVNTNKGLFKSEKQASFLQSQSVDGVIYSSQTLAFGEFGGCKRVIRFEFVLDCEGVQVVYKVNSKNERSTYWKREDSFIKAFEARYNMKQIKQDKADKINAVRASLDRADAFEKVLKGLLCNTLLAIKPEEMTSNSAVLSLTIRLQHVKGYKTAKEAKHTKLLSEF